MCLILLDLLSQLGGTYRLMRIFMIFLILSQSPEVLCASILDYNNALHDGFLVMSFTNLLGGGVISSLLNWVEGAKVLRHFPVIWVFQTLWMWVFIWL